MNPNTVYRQVVTMEGRTMGYVFASHDGTPEGIIEAARDISGYMFAGFRNVSNMESLMIASDATGRPAWKVSPNFKHLDGIAPDASQNFRPNIQIGT